MTHEIVIVGPWTNDDSECVVIECRTCNVEIHERDYALPWSEAQDLVKAHVAKDFG